MDHLAFEREGVVEALVPLDELLDGDVGAAVARAVANPVGMASLRAVCAEARRVTVIVDDPWAPRLICFSVSRANQRSTRLSHDGPVGVKCRCKRGRLASHRPMSAVLCVP